MTIPRLAASLVALLALLVPTSAGPGGPWRSALFPEDWAPGLRDGEGRGLPDFSWAGYRGGEEPPDRSGAARTFAVRADATGGEDATGAIRAALDRAAASGGGVVVLPAGIFRIDGTLEVEASGVVLAGAGAERTRLLFTRAEGMSHRSHLTFLGDVRHSGERPLAADAGEGETVVLVPDASGLAPGDDVDLGFTITEDFVAAHRMRGVWKAFNGTWQPIFRREVRAVDRSRRPHRVTLDVPLRYPMLVRDGASLRVARGWLAEVGVEDLGVCNATDEASAWSQSQVHAVEFAGVKDGWIRGVRSFPPPDLPPDAPHLASGGLLVRGCKRVTVADCVMEMAQHRGGGGNGYLFEVRQSGEVLFRDCRARRGRHNFIQNWGFGTTGCVWLRCESREGEAINNVLGRPVPVTGYSEYHHSLATANLVDSCHVGDGWAAINRLMWSSGAGHTATECVFWNITGTGKVLSAQFGNGYVIGTGPEIDVQAPEGDWVEGAGRAEDLRPRSLYEEQRRLRREREAR